MNFSRAFNYIFEDRDGLNKLVVVFILTFGAALLSPVLIGLALWAVLLGYQVELVRNWREGMVYPLPRWTDLGGKLNTGGMALIAVIVYNIPNMVLGCGIWFMSQFLGGDFSGASGTLAIACCLFPLLVLYNIVIQPMLALGMGRYAEEESINAFFRVGELFGLVRANLDTTIQYLLLSLAASLVLSLVGAVPCIGWVVTPALLVPVQGALVGQYAARILGKPQAKKPKRG